MVTSHSLVPDQKLHEEFPEDWDRLVRAHVDIHKYYYDNVIKEIRSRDAPVHVIRFEDMRRNAYPVTKDMMKFILASDDLEDTVCDHNIMKTCKVDGSAKAIYKIEGLD